MNENAPIFSSIMVNKNGQSKIDLSSFKDKSNVVLFFYPKNNTPNCSLEARAFSNNLDKFKALDTEVFGISGGNSDSHENFIKKCDLALNLILDENNSIAKQYKALNDRGFFNWMGLQMVSRKTFFIDKNLKIIKIWEDVDVYNHVNEVLEFIKKYKN